jgi:ribose transport system substrate-binding protein
MVVSFDTAATSPNGVIVNPDQEELGHNAAEFLAKQLKPGDTVVTLDGIAGSPINAERLKGVKDVFKKAGVKIVGSATTNWDQAQGQSATVNLLTAHPNVNAIYSQSGGVSLGALNAMKQMGHPVVPITGGDSYNGFLKAWKKLKDENGFSSYASSNLPEMSVTALKVAIEAVRGKDPGHLVKDVPPVVTNENLDKYVRPDLSDSLWLPTTLPESVLEKQYKK